jgi:hypothetical protein
MDTCKQGARGLVVHARKGNAGAVAGHTGKRRGLPCSTRDTNRERQWGGGRWAGGGGVRWSGGVRVNGVPS